MGSYDALDPILEAWAARNTLYVSKKDRDDEVRSILVVGSKGLQCQIWLEPPSRDGLILVQVSNQNKQLQAFTGPVGELVDNLENALDVAKHWCEMPSRKLEFPNSARIVPAQKSGNTPESEM